MGNISYTYCVEKWGDPVRGSPLAPNQMRAILIVMDLIQLLIRNRKGHVMR